MASLFRPSPQRPTIEIPQSTEPESERQETIDDEEETVCQLTFVDGGADNLG